MNNTKLLVKSGSMAALMLTLMLSTVLTAFAQEKTVVKEKKQAKDEKENSKVMVYKKADGEMGDEHEVKVRVENGKVWVNGEEVANIDMQHMGDMERMSREMTDGFRLRSRLAMPDMPDMPGFEGHYAFVGDHASGMRDAELMKLEMQSRELAMKIRSEKGDTTALKRELEDLLNRIFDQKQELRQNQIAKMRAELEKLEQNTADRASHRSDMIAKRLNDLLGTSSNMEW